MRVSAARHLQAGQHPQNRANTARHNLVESQGRLPEAGVYDKLVALCIAAAAAAARHKQELVAAANTERSGTALKLHLALAAATTAAAPRAALPGAPEVVEACLASAPAERCADPHRIAHGRELAG